MAETDPFGRAQNDDPLGEMGWTSAGTAPPGSGPSEVASPEQPDAAVRRAALSGRDSPVPPDMPAQVRRRLRRRGLGCATAFVVVVVLAPIGAILGTAVDEDGAERPSPLPAPVEEEPRGGGTDVGEANEQGPPRGLSPRSMLRRGNLAPALEGLRDVTASTRVRLVRIDAGNVIVQAVGDGGRTVLAQARWDGEPEVLSRSTGGAGRTFAWSRIDPSAPNRIVRAATRGRRASTFDYLVLIDAVELQWSAFLKNGGGTFTGSLDGRTVRPLGG